jgi:hypothetical protein
MGGQLKWSGGSKVSVNGGTTQMVRWKQGQCEWGNNSNGQLEEAISVRKGTGNKSIRQQGVEASAV